MPDNEPSWRQNAGGPKKQAKKLGWQQEDPRAGSGAGGKRSFKLFALSALACAAIGGIAYLIYLLLPSDRPGLLVIAADPAAAADRLDHPYDPAGYLSAKRILAWADAVKAEPRAPQALTENPLWADDVDSWAQRVGQADKIDPVVIYFGLHTGTTKGGDPVIYPGRPSEEAVVDRETGGVRVKTVLDKLQEHAGKKRKVLVFDNGRGLPEAHRGELYADFARAVADRLGSQIAGDTNLTVILGAADGERGWDSPDLGLTPLAHRLVAALGGKAAPPAYDSFTAFDLHAYLAKEVNAWAKSNRPGGQNPVLLPGAEAWQEGERKDVYGRKKFFRWDPAYDAGAEATKIAGPAPAELPADAKAKWAACRDAADPAAGAPRPETYTPAAWRRYRELLLRYETATLLGDDGGRAVLAAALTDLEGTMARGRTPAVESKGLSFALPAALGVPADDAAKAAAVSIDRLAAGAGTAADLAKFSKAGARPTVEAQLLTMLHFFYTGVLDGKDPTDRLPDDLARAAARTRMSAERAALAVRPTDPGFPYSERLWPMTRAAVLAGDALRREAEDLSLAYPGGDRDAHAAAREKFLAAAAEYRRADALAAKLQAPLRLRDKVFADLPFLGAWAPEADLESLTAEDAANGAVRLAWAAAHDLADKLDRVTLAGGPPTGADLDGIKTAAAEAEKTYAAAVEVYRAEVKRSEGGGEWQQGKWRTVEQLLRVPVPLLPADDRERLVKSYRVLGENLNRDGKQSTIAEDSAKRPAGVKGVRRAKMAAAVLAAGEWGRRTETDPAASRSVLETTASRLTEKDFSLTNSAEAGAAVAANYAKLARVADSPTADAAARLRGETFARLAVPFAAPPDPEPAVAARNRRWRDLLEAQALRAARDHWYDENQQPYSAGVARAYLADAAKVAGPGAGPPGPDVAAATALLAVEPLRLTCDGAGPVETLWTSEASRRLKYAFARADYPISGHAVLWWKSDAPETLSVTSVPRQPVPLTEALDRPIEVRTGARIEEAARTLKPATVTAAGFFRGQKDGLGHAAKFLVNRRPDLVVSDAYPADGGMVAVRADKEFDPGAVAIVIDLSGSMTEKARDDAAATKKREVLDTLNKILPRIPGGTKLTIRYFVDEKENSVRRQLFPGEGRFKNKFFRDEIAGPEGLIATLDKIDPDGNTPLLPAINDAVTEDLPKDFRGVKTVLVLTDGADTSEVDTALPELEKKYHRFFPGKDPAERVMNEGQRKRVVEAVRRKLVADYDRPNNDVSIQMVFFGAKLEADMAREMFEVVEKFPTPGKLYFAENKDALYEQLDTALRPKVRIRRSAGAVPGLPEGGVPVNRTDDSQVTWWARTDALPAGDYTFSYHRHSQPVGLGPNDRLVVRLVNPVKGTNPHGFVREVVFGTLDLDEKTKVVGLYADKPGSRFAANAVWHVAVPEYAAIKQPGGTYLLAETTIEAKYDFTPAEGGELRQIYPKFVWFDLARVPDGGGAEVRQPGPVYVRPATGLPAPAWQVIADDDGVADFKAAGNRLRAWVYDRRPPRFGEAMDLKPAALAAAEQRFTPAQDVVVRVTFEPVAFVPDPKADKRQQAFTPRIPPDAGADTRWCVVARVEDPQGRTFHARLLADGRETSLGMKEHRYFFVRKRDEPAGAPQPVAAKVAGYTAAFGRLSAAELAGYADLKIELVNVGDLTADRTNPADAKFTVELGKPTAQDVDPLLVTQPSKAPN